jgi:hypothetical protein
MFSLFKVIAVAVQEGVVLDADDLVLGRQSFELIQKPRPRIGARVVVNK